MSLTGSREAADDLAQLVCARALEKADQFEPGTHVDRWVFRIAQRQWYNAARAERVRRGTGLVPAELAELVDPAPDAEMNIFVAEVLSSIAALPEAQRSVVMLVYAEGFSYAEAAEILSIPEGTVMSRLAAARKTLKAQLGEAKGAE